MTNKVQKIREEVEIVVNRRLNLLNGDYFDLNEETDGLTNEIMDIIDPMQEKPLKIKKGCKYRCLSDMVNKDTGNISFIGDKVYLAPKDNTLLSEENGWLCDISENPSNFELIEEPVSEDLEEAAISYAATGEILDNGKEMIDFQKEKSFKAGANWQKEHLLTKAVDAVVKIDAGGYPYVDSTIELYDYDKDIPLAKRGDKVKILVIKES